MALTGRLYVMWPQHKRHHMQPKIVLTKEECSKTQLNVSLHFNINHFFSYIWQTLLISHLPIWYTHNIKTFKHFTIKQIHTYTRLNLNSVKRQLTVKTSDKVATKHNYKESTLKNIAFWKNIWKRMDKEYNIEYFHVELILLCSKHKSFTHST